MFDRLNIIPTSTPTSSVWNQLRQGSNAHDQGRELAAFDASTKALDFSGQTNTFIRKYSFLIKELRQ